MDVTEGLRLESLILAGARLDPRIEKRDWYRTWAYLMSCLGWPADSVSFCNKLADVIAPLEEFVP